MQMACFDSILPLQGIRVQRIPLTSACHEEFQPMAEAVTVACISSGQLSSRSTRFPPSAKAEKKEKEYNHDIWLINVTYIALTHICSLIIAALCFTNPMKGCGLFFALARLYDAECQSTLNG